MRAVTDGEGSLDVDEVRFGNPGHWTDFYGLEEPLVKVLRQDKTVRLAEGETARFATGLSVAPADATAGLGIALLRGPVAAMGTGDDRWLVASGSFEAGEVAFTGEMALLGSGMIAVADATDLTIGAETLLLCSSGGMLFAGSDDGSVIALDDALEVQWSWQAPEAISAVVAGDLDGDGEPEAVAGSEDHFIYALDGGEVTWEFEVRAGEYLGGPQKAKDLLIADLDADGGPEGWFEDE